LFFDGDYLGIDLWERVLGGLFDGVRGIRPGKNFASAVEISWILQGALFVLFCPLEEFEAVIPHRDLGAGWNGTHLLCLTVVLDTDHKLLFLAVEGINSLLFLVSAEGVMVGSEGFILLGQSVTDDVAAKRVTVGFLAFVATGLKFPSWKTGELFKFMAN
jgi:hypothetical protein